MSESPTPPRRGAGGISWTDTRSVQVVRIRLGDERAATQPDPLGRRMVGYADGLAAAELWERGRGVWKARLAQLAECDLAVIVHAEVVVAVGTVEAVARHGDRVAVQGRPLTGHPLLGQRDPLHNTSRNPITYGAITTVLPASTPPRSYDAVLQDAVAVLSEAARLRRQVMRPVEGPGGDQGLRNARWEVDPDRTERSDWAEFVTLALAGATANVGGISAALAGRPGSWEAAGVRSLLESTVGPDEHDLWRHRTEPLAITLYIENLVNERTRMWEAYDAAERAIRQMIEDAEAANPPTDLEPYMWLYTRTVNSYGEPLSVGPWEPIDPTAPAWSIEAWRAVDPDPNPETRAYFERMLLGEEPGTNGVPVHQTWLPRSPELGAEYDRLEQEREDRLGTFWQLEEQIEEQRLREIADYGQALKERVEAAARALPGLTVPVHVDVDLTWSSQGDRLNDMPYVVEHLIEQAVLDTPTPEDLPGTPLSRLLQTNDDRGDQDPL